VQLENSQNETAFLREEQEGDKIKIGELEGSLTAAQTTIEDMLEQTKEERRQRDLIDNKEKAEVQKVLDEINAQAATAKDELRKLRKKLADKEREAETWKERLETLENNLREALGDLNGTRSSLLKVRSLPLKKPANCLGRHQAAARSGAYALRARDCPPGLVRERPPPSDPR
jgi:predicted  nucleic acid-binding Zn-ribbon protein